jgi:outer membrane protein assembly factor BamD
MNSAFTRRADGSFLLALISVALVVMSASGCGGSRGGFASGSFERGEERYEAESWYEAVEDLRLFIRRAPTDPRAAEAQYMIGMARYYDEDYPVAAVEFEILRNDYPTSELADDAWYMQGMCYVEQVPGTDLDQTPTRQAVEHFVRYLREHPAGKHRTEVEAELDKLNRHLDQKELNSARLYRDMGRWQAAAVTVDTMLETRPNSELRPEMLLLAGEVHLRRVELSEARENYRQFLRDYPDHERVKEAERGLERIDGKAADGEGR